MFVLSCDEFDTEGACVSEVWVFQQSILPPLTAEEGLVISSAIITVCAIAWGLKAVRRMIWPKA